MKLYQYFLLTFVFWIAMSLISNNNGMIELEEVIKAIITGSVYLSVFVLDKRKTLTSPPKPP